ncbi:MAG: hypothetical protein JWP49_428 [Phenylobacterium sp.]|nr:hypothetical protein [Phenylobacterium sp.]
MPADGDAQAALALGRRLLIGDGAAFDPEAGARQVDRAAQAGSSEALLLRATLAASGAGRPQDWDQAFDDLQAAVDLGHAGAAAQLRLLAGAWTEEGAPPAARIDLQAWLSPPPRQVLCDAPRLRTITGFLPPAICRWIIGQAAGRLQRATMFNPVTRRDEPHPGRDSQLLVMDILGADVVFALVRARISAALNIPLPCFEPTQILNYRTGQTFAPHYDYLEARTFIDYLTGEPYEGQRIVTFLVYLNDDFEGGETTFPKADVRFKGQAGDVLFFANVDTDQRPDRQSLHAGLAPVGEKWLLSQWIQDRPFTGVMA